MKRKSLLWLFYAIAIFYFLSFALADVVLNPLFSDCAVLQRDAKVVVWGTALPGEKITVKIDQFQVSCVADENGSWQVVLPEHKAGGPYEMTVTGKNTIVLKDIYYGDVWFCSGQSNMAMTVAASNNAAEEIKNATNNLIRHFKVMAQVAEQPSSGLRGSWKVCSPASVGTFSATAYYFAKNLQPESKVAIGLINSSVGGTRIEAWMSRNAIEKISELKSELELQDKNLGQYKAAIEEYEKRTNEWQDASEKAKQQGLPVPEKPQQPKLPLNPNSLSVLYNGMVAPVAKFPVKGFLWYQGEANTRKNPQLYGVLLSALIDDWKNSWKQQLPFIFVQLPNIGKPVETWENNNWAILRESQLEVLRKQNTAMAITIDIGEANNIHPKNKQEVGRRLALAALGTVYGKKIVYSGPIYSGMNIEGNKIRLKFAHIGSGLIAKDSDTLNGFVIAGEDKNFVKAQAKIENDTVVVWSETIEKPVAVRYAWAGNPVCNLYNKEGLPASPFRTDQW